MSQFKNKIQTIRQTKLNHNQNKCLQQTNKNMKTVCSAQIKLRGHCSNSPRQHLMVQHPIYIVKKQHKQTKPKKQVKQFNSKVKKVEPFVPIQIPNSPRGKIQKIKSLYDNTQSSTPCRKKQIQIHIDNENDNKQCLKKLFKKIHKLTQDLAQSQKQRIRLQLQLNNLKDVDGLNREQQKNLIKLEGENYKLRSDIDYLKQLLKQRNNQIAALKNKVPSQIIKQIIVEKPVQVRVQVPKYVSGPQKIIQVPKFMQNKTLEKQLEIYRKKVNDLQTELSDQKKKNMQILNRPSRDFQIPVIIQKPIYLEKPIYIDRPIYIEKPYEKQRIIEVPVQIPYEVPVYIDKPIIDNDLYLRISEMERDMQNFASQNEELRRQNYNLRLSLTHLQNSLQVVRRHNCQKNHQIELLLRNTEDYNPIRVKQVIKKQTRVLGRGQNLRNAQIINTFNPTLNRNF